MVDDDDDDDDDNNNNNNNNTYKHTYIHTYIHTYLLTTWNKVLLEKLTGSQLVKKFSAFYGNRTFITAFTGARHLSIS